VTNGRAALGVRAHSGWAAVVAVCGSLDEPLVLASRRLEVVPSADVMHTQPYHVAAELGAQRGRLVVDRCAADAEARAKTGLARLTEELVAKTFAACAILTPRAREPLDFERTLRSHALVHAAEGMLFRTAFARAAAACDLEVHAFEEDEIIAVAASRLGERPEGVERRLSDLGRVAGRPWTRDQKLAALAGLLALAPPKPAPKRRAQVRIASKKRA
jgi:hypothetical protein